MKLSEIDSSVYYTVEIPSTKKKTKFRPFLVKEERALLIAHESEDKDTMLSTLEAVVRSCLKDAPEYLTTFDVEYLFVKIRSKSVSETADITGNCSNCGGKTDIQVDLEKVEVVTPEGHVKNIKLSGDIAVVMRYPSMDEVAEIAGIENPVDQKMRSVAVMVETVFFKDQVFHTKDGDIEETIAFLDNRTDDEFAKITQFLDTIPSIRLVVEYKCMHCGTQNKVTLSSIKDFF